MPYAPSLCRLGSLEMKDDRQSLTMRHSRESENPECRWWEMQVVAANADWIPARAARGPNDDARTTVAEASVHDSSLPDGSTLTGGSSRFFGGHRTETRTETVKIPATTPNAIPTGIL